MKATEQPVDTSTAAGKAFLDMLGRLARISGAQRGLRRPQYTGVRLKAAGCEVIRAEKASGARTELQALLMAVQPCIRN